MLLYNQLQLLTKVKHKIKKTKLSNLSPCSLIKAEHPQWVGLRHCSLKRREAGDWNIRLRVIQWKETGRKGKNAHPGWRLPGGQQTKMYCETSSSVRWCENDGFQPSHNSMPELSNNDRGWKDRTTSLERSDHKSQEKHCYWNLKWSQWQHSWPMLVMLSCIILTLSQDLFHASHYQSQRNIESAEHIYPQVTIYEQF